MKSKVLVIIAIILTTQVNAQTNVFNSTGNAGIATSSPGQYWQGNALQIGAKSIFGTLSVNGFTYLSHNMSFTGTNFVSMNGGDGILIGLSPGGLNVDIGHGMPAAGSSFSSMSSGLSIKMDGHCGIGTSTPLQSLSVEGNIAAAAADNAQNSYLFFQRSDGYIGGRIGNAYAGGWGGHLVFETNGGEGGVDVKERMRIGSNGNIGIGTATPTVYSQNTSLAINNSIGSGLLELQASGVPAGIIYTVPAALTLDALAGRGIVFHTNNNAAATILPNGYFGIGYENPTDKLAVNGNISANGLVKAKQLKITQSGWSDDVFDEDYKLRALTQVESFIKVNKHLPDVPTAKEVEKNGINIGDSQALLLRKIEELTIYMIEADKERKELRKELSAVKQELQKIVKIKR